jgi:tetratricopeptide (TPR) repeat protein
MAEFYKHEGNKKLYAYLLDRAAETGYDSASTLGNTAIIWSNDFETPEAPQKAEELFNKALLVDPENELLYFNAGSFYGRIGALDRAAQMFEKSSQLNPGNIMSRIYLSRVKQELEKKEAYASQQKEQSAHYEKAREYFAAKDYDNAIAEFNRDIQQNPALDRSYFHLGLIHSMRNEIELAVPYYEKAVEYNKKSIPAINNLGLCYLKLKMKARAREMFELSLSLDPNQERVKKTLAGLK